MMMASNALVWPNTQTAVSSHVQVPYKFVHLGEVTSYLNNEMDQDVDIIDAKAGNLNYHDIANQALNEYDSVAMFVRPDNVEDANETARMINRVSPDTDIVAYGDLTVYLPTVFQENDQLSKNFDGIAVPGDQEESIAQLFKYQEGNIDRSDITGLWFTGEEYSSD